MKWLTHRRGSQFHFFPEEACMCAWDRFSGPARTSSFFSSSSNSSSSSSFVVCSTSSWTPDRKQMLSPSLPSFPLFSSSTFQSSSLLFLSPSIFTRFLPFLCYFSLYPYIFFSSILYVTYLSSSVPPLFLFVGPFLQTFFLFSFSFHYHLFFDIECCIFFPLRLNLWNTD